MKSKQHWLGLGMASVIGLSVLAPIGEQVLVVQASSSLPFNPEVVKGYNATQPLLMKAEKSKSEADVKKAYESFVKMSQSFILSDQSVYKEGNDMDKLYERLRKLMYALPSGMQTKLLPQMADKWVDEVKGNTSTIMRFYLEDFLKGNKNGSVQDRFDRSLRKLNYYQTMPPDSKLPADWDKSVNQLSKEQDKVQSKPVQENTVTPPAVRSSSSTSNKPTNFAGNTSVELEKVGDTWYEVTVTYKDGKVSGTNKRKLTPKEAPHLYPLESSDTSTSDGGATGGNDKFAGLTQEEQDYLLQDQNQDSKFTIQYSLDKNGEKPYYFDTGLRVDKKMNASYEQYKDVLYQIAVKSNGYVVEDKGRVLVVIDKKPIIVKDIKKEYSEREIESLFESFPNIDIRVLETRIGTSTSLEQQIVSKQAKTVTIEGKKIDLDSTPIVREGRVLLPIKEVTSDMGATLKQKEDQFIVTKGKDTVIYQLKSKKIVVKGKEVDIGIAPDVKDGVLYVEMNELAKAFNYNLEWDGDSSELSFNKK